MQFVVSLTIDASLLRKLLALWDDAGDPRNPFANILITPLFASPSTMRLVREELKERRGANVYFDSGGYYVQQNKITFEELYRKLREFYQDSANHWADWYVLPDHVPVSSDSIDSVEQKVNDTITAASLFYAEMPAEIQRRAIPVIQGHTFTQINRCIEAYIDMSVNYMGFGSFGTNGANNSINVADMRSALNISHIAKNLEVHNVRIHTFGVSTPPVIYAFERLGIHSFDSLAWQRSAGYGKVYMPFTRAYNVSHRSTRNSALSFTEFELLKRRTDHSCPFCEDFYELSTKRLYRSLHNLTAILETIDPLKKQEPEYIASVIQWKSQRYYKLFKEIYLAE